MYGLRKYGILMYLLQLSMVARLVPRRILRCQRASLAGQQLRHYKF